MIYLMGQLWVWLCFSLLIGAVVGGLTCAPGPTRWSTGWTPWGTGLFLIGLTVAVLQILPGRMGYLLDAGLLMFASYLIGCCAGCLIRQAFTPAERAVRRPER